CEAFAKVLKIDKVGLDDDFFLLGGDSIRVMMLQRHLVDMKNITTIVNAGRTPRQIAAQYEEFISAMQIGADENGLYPLSDIQETYMNMCMPLEGRPLMHIRNLLLLDNEADLNKLASAIVVAVENHPGMFIRFHRGEDGVLKQKIEPETFEIVVENVSDEEFEAMKPTLVAPFRYLEEKLFSFRIFQTPAAKYLFYNIHHSIFDGESMNILLTDIERAYQGMPLEPEKDSFCNLAAEEAAIRLTPIYAEARDGFRASFSNAPRTLFLENAGSATLSLEYANLQTRAGEALSFCESAGITMNALTTAAFAFVLGRCTDSNDVVLGSQYSGRGDGRSANMVGSFAKPIPLRFRWNDNDSVDNFLHNAGEVLRDNIKNSIYKFLDLKQDGLF
ncbi:MAG: hypothetical protein HUJ90_07115, partial [Bacteroidales bacterium]|nr:hypothetical protein [Bacteroidales bacterium]